MILLGNYFKDNQLFLLLGFTVIFLFGCTTNVNKKIDNREYKKQLKTPAAKKYQINIDGIERNYFLVKNDTDSAEPSSEWLTLVLDGSGCIDEQPLLGLLYQNIPINSDVVALQKRGVQEGSSTLKRRKMYQCSPNYYTYNNHINRVQDNMFLVHHLLKKSAYKRITLIGVSEGVHIAYLMMNESPIFNEAVLLANHAANSIKGAYDAQALHLDKTFLGTLERYVKLHSAINQQAMDNEYVYGNYVKNWRTTFNSDQKNMGKVLSLKKNNRYLFIMGDNDHLIPSEKLKETKKIFCRNNHNKNLMLYKKNSRHDIFTAPRFSLHKVIADWLNKEDYQENSDFIELNCN